MPRSQEPENEGGRLSSDEVARLTDQIASLTRAGLPLPAGIVALGEELPRGRLRSALARLASALESGVSLESALAAQGERIPSHLRGLVTAAARTGRLGEVLGRFAGYANVGIDLRRALWIRLVNPIFTLFFAVGVFVFVSVVLVSGFANIFKDFGMPVPLVTRMAIGLSTAVARVWWPLFQGAIGLMALGLILSLLVRGDVRRGLAWMIPLFGPVWHLSDLAEFSHLLALLLESEVPLGESLRLAGEGVRNSEIASSARTAAQQVSEGLPLAEALDRRTLFPSGFAKVLAWAEDHRGLPEALHMAGEMFEARARSQANFVGTVCSILALLSLLFGALTVVMAILVPMIQLIHRLSG